MTELASQIKLALNTLARGSEGISAVLNTKTQWKMDATDENRFSKALGDLQRLSEEQNIPVAIVGGLAAIRYGYPAATQDIDVAIGQGQLDALISAATRYHFNVAWESKLGWHTLMHGDVEINIVPEGGRARDSSPTTIPGPPAMGVDAGLQYARLESWVELKISSDRQKDRAHVVEVLKKTEQPMIQTIRDHLAGVHAQYLSQFEQLLKQSQEEGEQEQRRR
jgi:hypothetical protein